MRWQIAIICVAISLNHLDLHRNLKWDYLFFPWVVLSSSGLAWVSNDGGLLAVVSYCTPLVSIRLRGQISWIHLYIFPAPLGLIWFIIPWLSEHYYSSEIEILSIAIFRIPTCIFCSLDGFDTDALLAKKAFRSRSSLSRMPCSCNSCIVDFSTLLYVAIFSSIGWGTSCYAFSSSTGIGVCNGISPGRPEVCYCFWWSWSCSF